MSNFSRLLLMLPVMALAVSTSHATPATTATSDYTVLDPSLKRLQDDFNADTGKVRLLYIVGPTCPVCLRGMDDLNKALAAQQDDPRLRTFVVYVPTLGAKESDIEPTVSLLTGKYVSRYWDPKGASGHQFENTLNIKWFAWDVWMIYGPEQRWDGAAPPVPDFWMDQLGGLSKWGTLDAPTFAKQVTNRLALIKAGGT